MGLSFIVATVHKLSAANCTSSERRAKYIELALTPLFKILISPLIVGRRGFNLWLEIPHWLSISSSFCTSNLSSRIFCFQHFSIMSIAQHPALTFEIVATCSVNRINFFFRHLPFLSILLRPSTHLIDDQSTSFNPNVTSWPCQSPCLHACSHSSLIKRHHAGSISPDRLQIVFEQYLSSGSEAGSSCSGKGWRGP